jgi:predicted Zn-dependent protease
LRDWTIFTIASYWQYWIGLIVTFGKAVRWRLQQITKPRPAEPVVLVTAPPRPAERPLNRLGQIVRHIPLALFWWAWSCVLLTGRIAGGSWHDFRAWLRFGQGYTLMRGLPALLVCAAVVWALLVPSFFRLPRSVLYRQLLDVAIRAGDLEEAELCAERLVRETKGNPAYLFTYACILGDKGERGRCLAIMQQLAPPDSPGYGPAQLGLAQLLISQKDQTADTKKEIENRLLLASRNESTSRAAETLLIRFYCGTGNFEKAEGYLGTANAATADAQLGLAMAFAAKGEHEKSMNHASLARQYFSSVVRNEPTNAEARLQWAQSAALMGDTAQAAAILEQGYQLTRAPGYRASLSRLFLAWAHFAGADPARNVDRIILLAKSVQCDDSNPMVVRTLLDTLPIDRPDANDIRSALDKAIAENNSPVILEIFLAVDSMLKKDAKEAAERFELARTADPQCSRILNNMAWTMGNTRPERLSLALDLIDRAVAQAPDQIRYLDTRGQILAKLERWQDAMADLQKAKQVLPDNKDLQETLARVSTHLPEHNTKNP